MLVLSTFLRGFTSSQLDTLKKRYKHLKRIAKNANLTDYKILILVQPQKGFTQSDRKTDCLKWNKAAKKIGGSLTLVYDFEYVFNEPTTLALNVLHRHAFEDLKADAFIYIDPNLPRWDKATRKCVKKGLVKCVKKIKDTNIDYVIGDYTPIVPANSQNNSRKKKDVKLKKTIEKKVKKKLNERFPKIVTRWASFNKLNRPRSEFYALKKSLYKVLKKYEETHSPIAYDYGLQMLLLAIVHNKKIHREDIGNIPELGTYTKKKKAAQLQRVDFQLSQLQ